MNKLIRITLSICLGVVVITSSGLLVSCRSQAEVSDKIGVIVTIPPQAEFVERIGGDKVDITVMVPTGANPHTYEPTPSQMAALSEGKLYMKVGSGVEFELVWMEKVIAQNKDMLLIDCSKGIELREIEAAHGHEGNNHEHEDQHEHEGNDHGHEDQHEHGAMDPHIWMSPLNAQVMAQNMCSGLISIDAGNTDYYEKNRDIYLEELRLLDKDIRSALSGVSNRTFIAAHDAFGYLADEYGLTMLHVEQGGKEPTAAAMAGLIDRARVDGISVVFASPQSNPQTAQVIAEAIDGRVVPIDPLARNYVDNLRLLLKELVRTIE